MFSPEWKTLSGGLWGDLKPETPPIPITNYFACGVGFRVEKLGQPDDTAANGLIMTYCNRDNWLSNASLPAEYGNGGDWFFVNCPNGFFINGGSVRF